MRNTFPNRAYFAVFSVVLSLLFVLTGKTASAAEGLPQPDGRVVLTITGNVGVTNAGNKAHFDMKMLSQLPQHQFTTYTPWTEGKHRFRGVLLSEVMERVEASGKRVRLVALNDYHHDIDMTLVRKVPFLLATHMDGKPMKIRDKGPVWLMLPLSDNKEFDTKRYHEMLVWQLKDLNIQ